MLDAVVGAVIMVIATTSLLSAVEVIETVFAQAGRQQLSVPEEQLLERIGLEADDEKLQFWQDSISNLPRDVVSSSP
jgi:cell division protein FtsL